MRLNEWWAIQVSNDTSDPNGEPYISPGVLSHSRSLAWNKAIAMWPGVCMGAPNRRSMIRRLKKQMGARAIMVEVRSTGGDAQ